MRIEDNWKDVKIYCISFSRLNDSGKKFAKYIVIPYHWNEKKLVDYVIKALGNISIYSIEEFSEGWYPC